jgi:hypothetical protein
MPAASAALQFGLPLRIAGAMGTEAPFPAFPHAPYWYISLAGASLRLRAWPSAFAESSACCSFRVWSTCGPAWPAGRVDLDAGACCKIDYLLGARELAEVHDIPDRRGYSTQDRSALPIGPTIRTRGLKRALFFNVRLFGIGGKLHRNLTPTTLTTMRRG